MKLQNYDFEDDLIEEKNIKILDRVGWIVEKIMKRETG